MRSIYRKKVIRAGCTVDIEYTYPTRYGEGLTRSRANGVGTPLAMENYNRELGIRRLTRIINENFCPGDIWLTLHYELEKRPKTAEDADKILRKFISKLKAEYKKAGIEFKCVRPKTAVGARGGLHHHMIIPKGLTTERINKFWRECCKAGSKARPPEHVILYEDGDYSSLAAYIYDHAEKHGTTLPEGSRRYSCTRNLRKPVEEAPKIIEGIKWQEPPVPWNGYFIDTDSVRAGCNPVTGIPYLFYRQIKLPPNFVYYDPESGKRLTGADAVTKYRRDNRKKLKEHWIDLAPEGEVVFKDKKGERQDE